MTIMPEVGDAGLTSALLQSVGPVTADGANRPARLYPCAKRAFDLTFTGAILLFIAPLLLFVALLLLCSQGRPIFIKHHRVGRHGRRFPCFKFRTMINGADEALAAHLARNPALRSEWEATRKLKNDPRVTPLGAVLRKSSVDEIPQLWNVVRGEMSLVGPRPIVDREVRYYGAAITKYYSIRPGLTGPWQISGRSDVSYATRVRLDEEYADRESFRRDLKILFKTVPAVMGMRGSY